MKQPQLSRRTKTLLTGLQVVLAGLILLIGGIALSSLGLLGRIFSGERPAAVQANQVKLAGGDHAATTFSNGHFHLTLNGQGNWLKLSAADWLLSVMLTLAALVLISLLVHRLRHGEFFVQANLMILHRLLWVVGAIMILEYVAALVGPGSSGLMAAVAATGLAVGLYVLTALFQRGFDLMQEGARLI
ncbi:hypothetical protein [Lacticaseibacillus camelliae]|nr:hypothetical protein [Lacticaseibacillus camelliae]